ncbi:MULTISPECIES: magnesium/cobalt transporter CorA [unclassified Siphonobacter]|uniref:magnesium/cobalt transporter CorA n=1 Tax=unclassified Siphonobacter TaxID=2635712 RepID=UPI000CB13989|nr:MULTISPECIES: magnesium/cobalt transporter CorA [unclassified Siphonobacter]MDQ1086249.1 magnesium transporter [Siphonobacter sp. SORGH_AS_1065]MDR6196532.1 magnesium transporter [Siphonobacter sp. SORGH_AS_0500]PKK35840.1 magnesium and cobalt transport protein CorA [Siphonobacter sp. SORGH_AS_0500]
MVRIYYKDGKQIRKENDVKELGHLQNVIWIDLQSANQEEEEWVENKYMVSFQTPQEIVEIESSARFFEQNDSLNANSNFLSLDSEGFRTYPVSMILRNGVLFTYRRGDSKTFADTVKRMKVTGDETFQTGADIMILLLETRIETDADLLESISRDVSLLSKSLTADQKPRQELLIRINTLQENTMLLRETIIDKQRVLSNIHRSSLFPDSHRERLRLILKDISSLLEYSTFNFERLEYLQNTFMGLVNLEQNQIIKIFTVVTIVFMPPTLIAGIFGMNFDTIPTTGHAFGFWLSLAMMLFSSVAVLGWFRRKHWI